MTPRKNCSANDSNSIDSFLSSFALVFFHGCLCLKKDWWSAHCLSYYMYFCDLTIVAEFRVQWSVISDQNFPVFPPVGVNNEAWLVKEPTGLAVRPTWHIQSIHVLRYTAGLPCITFLVNLAFHVTAAENLLCLISALLS